jgi:Holliday junction resolvasome RuvABC DNA-binding subunit
MTNQQIEYLSQKVAELVIAALEDKQKEWDTELVQELKSFEAPIIVSAEEKLLTELSEAMTALDYNLKQENYPRCAELKATILHLEQQLKQI